MEKSDEFDERILKCQSFPYQNFALKKFDIVAISLYNLSTGIYRVMSGRGILQSFGLEDPPENKELPHPSGPLSKVAPSRIPALSLITSCIAAEVVNQSTS